MQPENSHGVLPPLLLGRPGDHTPPCPSHTSLWLHHLPLQGMPLLPGPGQDFSHVPQSFPFHQQRLAVLHIAPCRSAWTQHEHAARGETFTLRMPLCADQESLKAKLSALTNSLNRTHLALTQGNFLHYLDPKKKVSALKKGGIYLKMPNCSWKVSSTTEQLGQVCYNYV